MEKNYAVFLPLCLFSLLFFSCSNMVSLFQVEKTTLSIVMPQSRMAYAKEEIASYTLNLVYAGSEFEVEPITREAYPGENIVFEGLNPGEYKIGLTGYNDVKKPIAAGSSNVTVIAGERNTATVLMHLARFYKISFDANGGSGTIDDVICDENGSFLIPAKCSFTPPGGKKFAGWSVTKDGAAVDYSSFPVTQNVTLYAVWIDEQEYKITYSFYGMEDYIFYDQLIAGTENWKKSFKPSELVTLPVYESNYVKISKWYVIQDIGTGVEESIEKIQGKLEDYIFTEIKPGQIVNDVYVIPCESDLTKFTITFYDGDNCYNENKIVSGVGKTTLSFIPEKEGLKLAGWSLSKNAEKVDYKKNEVIPLIENITLYAVWSEELVYNITYDLSNYQEYEFYEALVEESKKWPVVYYEGEKVTLPVFENKFIKITDWVVEADEGLEYEAFMEKLEEKYESLENMCEYSVPEFNADDYACDLILVLCTAVCTKFDISYYDGDTLITTEKFENIEGIIMPGDSLEQKGSAVFAGWSLAPDGDIRYEGGEKFVVTDNLKLYAIWSNSTKYEIEYEVFGLENFYSYSALCEEMKNWPRAYLDNKLLELPKYEDDYLAITGWFVMPEISDEPKVNEGVDDFGGTGGDAGVVVGGVDEIGAVSGGFGDVEGAVDEGDVIGAGESHDERFTVTVLEPGEYNRNLVLYPCFEEKASFSVKMYLNQVEDPEGLIADLQFGAYKLTMEDLSGMPLFEAYIFKGWSTSVEGDVDYVPGEEIWVTRDLTLFGVWEPIPAHEVFVKTYMEADQAELTVNSFLSTEPYIIPGGTYSPQRMIAEAGCYVTVPYNIVGWSCEPNGFTVYTPGETISVDSDLTLYAVLEPIQFDVTYDFFDIGIEYLLQEIELNMWDVQRSCAAGEYINVPSCDSENITILEWSANINGGEVTLKPEETVLMTSPGDVVVKPKKYSRRIYIYPNATEDGDGSAANPYTLEKGFECLDDFYTVYLKDDEISNIIPISSSLNINKKGVVIKSVEAGSKCTLSRESSFIDSQLITVSNGADLTIENVKFNSSVEVPAGPYTAGIFISDGGKLILESCEFIGFSNSFSGVYGSAICNYGTMKCTNSTYEGSDKNAVFNSGIMTLTDSFGGTILHTCAVNMTTGNVKTTIIDSTGNSTKEISITFDEAGNPSIEVLIDGTKDPASLDSDVDYALGL